MTSVNFICVSMICDMQADDGRKIVADHRAGHRKRSVLYSEIGNVTSRRVEQYSQFTPQVPGHSIHSDLRVLWYALLVIVQSVQFCLRTSSVLEM